MKSAPCKHGCTCGKHSPRRDTKTTEPYDMPIHDRPHGRFYPMGNGSFRAVILRNGE